MMIKRLDVFQAVSLGGTMLNSMNEVNYDIRMVQGDFWVRCKRKGDVICINKSNAPFWIPYVDDANRVFATGNGCGDLEADGPECVAGNPVEATTKPKSVRASKKVSTGPIETEAGGVLPSGRKEPRSRSLFGAHGG